MWCSLTVIVVGSTVQKCFKMLVTEERIQLFFDSLVNSKVERREEQVFVSQLCRMCYKN